MTDTIKYLLEENKMPKFWYNIAADLPKPLTNRIAEALLNTVESKITSAIPKVLQKL